MSERTAKQWEEHIKNVSTQNIFDLAMRREEQALSAMNKIWESGNEIQGRDLAEGCLNVEKAHQKFLLELFRSTPIVAGLFAIRTLPLRFGSIERNQLYAARQLVEAAISQAGNPLIHVPFYEETHFFDIFRPFASRILHAIAAGIALGYCRRIKRLCFVDCSFRYEPKRRGMEAFQSLPLPIPLQHTLNRAGSDSNILSAFGGAASIAEFTQITTKSVFLFQPGHFEPFVTKASSALQGGGEDYGPHYLRYIPMNVNLQNFWNYIQHPDFDVTQCSITEETIDCLLAIRLLSHHSLPTRSGMRQLSELGAVFSPRSVLMEFLPSVWSEMTADLAATKAAAFLPRDANDLLDRLARGNLTPLFSCPPRTVVFAKDWVWVDAIALARRFVGSVTWGEGSVGQRCRYKLFEGAVQSIIDSTPWSPSEKYREYVGKRMRKPDDKDLTDIDAVASQGDRLLLVSCKSTRKRVGAGDLCHKNLRNEISTTNRNVLDWKKKIDYFRQNPKGKNYDFVGMSIHGCVVAPCVFASNIAESIEMQVPGLPFFVSIMEFEKFLRFGDFSRDVSLWPGT